MPAASFSLEEYYWISRGRSRPPSVQQPPLPPFDPSDPGGKVWGPYGLPPEALPLPPNSTKTFFRGDAWGVTLPVSQTPPYVPGANTTPPNMVMSYFAPYYQRPVQDNILTAHCQRSYSHFHLDQWNWEQAGLSSSQAVQLMAYIQSWQYYTSFWGLSTSYGINWQSWAQAQSCLQPILSALQAAGSKVSGNTILLVGEELNSCTSPAGLLDIVTNLMPQCKDLGIDVWLHFTSNYASWPVSGQSQPEFWQSMVSLGVKGLCWQADQNQPAGTMGAEMYSARNELAGTGALLAAFELLASWQLNGKATELYTKLRSFEMLCCPQGIPSIPAVSGYNNGGSMPDGTPL